MSLFSKELEFERAVGDICCTLLEKCIEYGIKSIEVNSLGFSYPGIKGLFSKIIVHIDSKSYFNNITDCFILEYSDGTKLKLSQLKINSIGIKNLESAIYLEIDKKETDIYKKYSGFDTKKVHFENKTLVITDPCYFRNEDDYSSRPKEDFTKLITNDELISKNSISLSRIVEDYKERRRYEKELENWEKKNYIVETLPLIENSTLYGDWSCSIFNLDSNEKIGDFCADAGMVGIFDYEDLTQDLKDWIKVHPWCACVIKNFTGDVWMEIEKEGIDNSWEDYSVHVIGKGNINFKSVQVGF